MNAEQLNPPQFMFFVKFQQAGQDLWRQGAHSITEIIQDMYRKWHSAPYITLKSHLGKKEGQNKGSHYARSPVTWKHPSCSNPHHLKALVIST